MAINKSKLQKIKKSELIELLMGLLQDEDEEVSQTSPEVEETATVQEKAHETEREKLMRHNQEVLTSKGIEKNKSPGRTESIKIGPRDNLFLKRENSFKNDPEVKRAEKLDKLMPPSEPSPRERQSEYVNMTCDQCGRAFRMHSSMVMRGSLVKCNGCSSR